MIEQLKRRFIAGAVCPKCTQLDKIVTYSQEGKTFRECVSCGFKDELRITPQQRELQTRVNSSAEAEKEETQAVKILGRLK